MNEPPKTGLDKIFDATPYLNLFIDKEGRWFQNGVEIVHPLIYKQFNLMLEKSGDREYLVRLGREICRVTVEDAPFVVQRVSEQDEGMLALELNDGTIEPFSPEDFWIGDENVPYVEVKQGAFHARFTRPAYYQIARYITWDDAEDRFCFTVGNSRMPVKNAPSETSP
jgi:uncharacterized protein